MSTQKDTKIQEIKGKIINSLLINENNDLDCNIRDGVTLPLNPSAITGSIKEKAIRLGLKNKEIIKKVPAIGAFSKKLYHSILWDNSESNGFNVVSGAQVSPLKKIKLFYKKIPFLGFMTWWLYMFFKMPSKVNDLFGEVAELKKTSKLKARWSTNFGSDVRDLKNRYDALEDKMNGLVAEIERLKANRVDDAQPKISELKKTAAR